MYKNMKPILKSENNIGIDTFRYSTKPIMQYVIYTWTG